MLAVEVMPDHIHLFVGAKPKHTPFKIVKQLKGNTSIQLRRFSNTYLIYSGAMEKDFLTYGLKDITVEVQDTFHKKQLKDIFKSKKEKMCLSILSLEVHNRR